MSAVPAQFQPAPRRAPQTPRRLRPAPERERRAKPRLIYAIIALGGVAVIVVAQLLLSIAVTQGAYEIAGYQAAQAELAREEQKLSEDLDRVQSPQFLALNAEALGMVPNANPVFLRLSDGSVQGEPTAADGAGASGSLVPNTLIDGVPLVTQQPTGETPSGGTPGQAADGGTPAPEVAPAPPADGGLPTPATH